MEWVRIALSCGHLLEGTGWFEVGDEGFTTVECPEGCGWMEFVLEPGDDGGCLCPPGGHICEENRSSE